MTWHRDLWRLLVGVPTVVLALMLAVGVGCASSRAARTPLADALESLADQRSLARLPHDATVPVVVSVRHGVDPFDLPAGQSRSLAFVGGLALVEVQPAACEALAAAARGHDVVIWGAGPLVARLGSSLREQLAWHAAAGSWQTATLPAIAVFASPTDDLPARLAELDVQVGSASEGLVTLSASPEALLDLLALADLTSLQSPADQRPLQEMTR